MQKDSQGFGFNNVINLFPAQWNNNDADDGNNNLNLIPKYAIKTPDFTGKAMKVIIEEEDHPSLPAFNHGVEFKGKGNLNTKTSIKPRPLPDALNARTLAHEGLEVDDTSFVSREATVLIDASSFLTMKSTDARKLHLDAAGVDTTHDSDVHKFGGPNTYAKITSIGYTNNTTDQTYSAHATTGNISLNANNNASWTSQGINGSQIQLKVDSLGSGLVTVGKDSVDLRKDTSFMNLQQNLMNLTGSKVDISASSNQNVLVNSSTASLSSKEQTRVLGPTNTKIVSSITGTDTFGLCNISRSATDLIEISSNKNDPTALSTNYLYLRHGDSIVQEGSNTNICQVDINKKLSMGTLNTLLSHDGNEVVLQQGASTYVKIDNGAIPKLDATAASSMAVESTQSLFVNSTQNLIKSDHFQIQDNLNNSRFDIVYNSAHDIPVTVNSTTIEVYSDANKSLMIDSQKANFKHDAVVVISNDTDDHLKLGTVTAAVNGNPAVLGAELKHSGDSINLSGTNIVASTQDMNVTVNDSYVVTCGSNDATDANTKSHQFLADKDTATEDFMKVSFENVQFPKSRELNFWYKKTNTQEHLNDVLTNQRDNVSALLNIMGGNSYSPNLRTSQEWLTSLSYNKVDMLDMQKAGSFVEGDEKLAHQIFQLYKNVNYLEETRNQDMILSLNNILKQLDYETKYGSDTFNTVVGFVNKIDTINSDKQYIEASLRHLLNNSNEYIQQVTQDYTHREYVAYARDDPVITITAVTNTIAKKNANYLTDANGYLIPQVDSNHADYNEHNLVLLGLQSSELQHLVPVAYKLNLDSDYVKYGWMKLVVDSGVNKLDTTQIYSTQFYGSSVVTDYLIENPDNPGNNYTHSDYVYSILYYPLGDTSTFVQGDDFHGLSSSTLLPVERNNSFYLVHFAQDTTSNHAFLIVEEEFTLDTFCNLFKTAVSTPGTESAGTYTYQTQTDIFALTSTTDTLFEVTSFHIDTFGRVFKSTEIPLAVQYNSADPYTRILSSLSDIAMVVGTGTRTTTIKTLVMLSRQGRYHAHYGSSLSKEMDLVFVSSASNIASTTTKIEELASDGFNQSNDLPDGYTHVGKVTFIPKPSSSRFVQDVVHMSAEEAAYGSLLYVKYTKSDNSVDVLHHLLKGPLNSYEIVDTTADAKALNLFETIHVEIGKPFTSYTKPVISSVSGDNKIVTLSTSNFLNWDSIAIDTTFVGYFELADGSVTPDLSFTKLSTTTFELEDQSEFDSTSNPANQTQFVVGSRDHAYVVAYDSLSDPKTLEVHSRYFETNGTDLETLQAGNLAIGIRAFGNTTWTKVCDIDTVTENDNQKYKYTIEISNEDTTALQSLGFTSGGALEGFMRADVQINLSTVFTPPLTLTTSYNLNINAHTIENNVGDIQGHFVGVPGVHSQKTLIAQIDLTNREQTVGGTDGEEKQLSGVISNTLKLHKVNPDPNDLHPVVDISPDLYGNRNYDRIFYDEPASSGIGKLFHLTEQNNPQNLGTPRIKLYYESRQIDSKHWWDTYVGSFHPDGYYITYKRWSNNLEDSAQVTDTITSDTFYLYEQVYALQASDETVNDFQAYESSTIPSNPFVFVEFVINRARADDGWAAENNMWKIVEPSSTSLTISQVAGGGNATTFMSDNLDIEYVSSVLDENQEETGKTKWRLRLPKSNSDQATVDSSLGSIEVNKQFTVAMSFKQFNGGLNVFQNTQTTLYPTKVVFDQIAYDLETSANDEFEYNKDYFELNLLAPKHLNDLITELEPEPSVVVSDLPYMSLTKNGAVSKSVTESGDIIFSVPTSEDAYNLYVSTLSQYAGDANRSLYIKVNDAYANTALDPTVKLPVLDLDSDGNNDRDWNTHVYFPLNNDEDKKKMFIKFPALSFSDGDGEKVLNYLNLLQDGVAKIEVAVDRPSLADIETPSDSIIQFSQNLVVDEVGITSPTTQLIDTKNIIFDSTENVDDIYIKYVGSNLVSGTYEFDYHGTENLGGTHQNYLFHNTPMLNNFKIMVNGDIFEYKIKRDQYNAYVYLVGGNTPGGDATEWARYELVSTQSYPTLPNGVSDTFDILRLGSLVSHSELSSSVFEDVVGAINVEANENVNYNLTASVYGSQSVVPGMQNNLETYFFYDSNNNGHFGENDVQVVKISPSQNIAYDNTACTNAYFKSYEDVIDKIVAAEDFVQDVIAFKSIDIDQNKYYNVIIVSNTFNQFVDGHHYQIDVDGKTIHLGSASLHTATKSSNSYKYVILKRPFTSNGGYSIDNELGRWFRDSYYHRQNRYWFGLWTG